MSLASKPGSMAKGTRHEVYVVSRTHGRQRLPIAQNCNIGDKLTSELIGEMGTKYPVYTSATYEGSEVAFDVFDSDLNYLYSMLTDVDPSEPAIGVNPEDFYSTPFTVFGNQIHETSGAVFQGFVAQRILLNDHSVTQDVKGNKKITFKGLSGRARYVRGCGVDYNRITGGSANYETAEDKTWDGSNYSTLNYDTVDLPDGGESNYTYNWLIALKNGVPQEDGFSMYSNYVILSSNYVATDVWEFFTPSNYVSE